MTSSRRKAFSQELHTQNDLSARAAVLDYLRNSGCWARENDDRYGPDIELLRGLRPQAWRYIEVEVKHGWSTGPDFPYKTVQLPSRKKKFTELGLPCDFYVLSKDLKFAIVIADTLLEDSLLKEVPNKLVESGEFFYQVPVDKCIIISLE